MTQWQIYTEKSKRGDCLTSIRGQMAELASINYDTYTHTPVMMWGGNQTSQVGRVNICIYPAPGQGFLTRSSDRECASKLQQE